MKALGRGSVSSFLMALLNGGWWATAAALSLATLLVIASPFVAMPDASLTIPVSFSLDTSTIALVGLPPGAVGTPDRDISLGRPGFGLQSGTGKKDVALHVRGSLRFTTSSAALIASNALLLARLLALVLWTIGQLRAVFRTLRDGTPFVPANATRIRLIGFAIIAGELARAATVFVENYYAMTHFSAAALRFDAWPDVNMFALINGLVILVISEVFRAGTRLDEEQSLTV